MYVEARTGIEPCESLPRDDRAVRTGGPDPATGFGFEGTSTVALRLRLGPPL